MSARPNMVQRLAEEFRDDDQDRSAPAGTVADHLDPAQRSALDRLRRQLTTRTTIDPRRTP